MSEKYSGYLKARKNLRELDKEMSYEIVEKYEPFIGKKIVYYYKNYDGSEIKSKVGYLKEFKWYWGHTFITDGLYPMLAKVKKDGSMSNAMYPEAYNTRVSVMEITRMEIVDD